MRLTVSSLMIAVLLSACGTSEPLAALATSAPVASVATATPTSAPTAAATLAPTLAPPTNAPTVATATAAPTLAPPTSTPTAAAPTAPMMLAPSPAFTAAPTVPPPTTAPTAAPTSAPTATSAKAQPTPKAATKAKLDPTAPAPAEPAPAEPAAAPAEAAPAPAASAPVRLVIPAIALDTKIVSVGLDANRVPIVPDHNVGWYNLSAMPGQGENIVLWGHVLRFRNAPNIPAPFARLKELKPGATLTLYDAQGGTHSYRIVQQVRVTPNQVEYILPKGRELLTMVSCTGASVIVRGEVVDKTHRLITIAEPMP